MTIEIDDQDVLDKKVTIWPNALFDFKINGHKIHMIPKDHIQSCEECRFHNTPVCELFSCYIGVYTDQV